MQISFSRLIIALVTLSIFTSACKKTQDTAATNTTPTPTPVAADADKVKDSVLYYSKDIYLWYNQIPATFNAKSYADPDKIMTAIRQYSVEPGFTTPVDRWSFAIKKADWNNLSTGIGANISSINTSGDFGFGVFFFANGDLRVKSVERESPAGIAGIQRAWRIIKINGSTNITTSNSSAISDAVYNATQSSFSFLKPDGTSVDITLNVAHYKEHPIYLDTVYTLNSKKIGYFVFNSFIGDTTEIYNEFNRVFSKFSNDNINDVIVDLRYNGGGYVTVQQKLANYLVSSSANNSVMMKEQFNDKNASDNSTTYFKKTGSLNLSRIFFIVSNSTASASELLINNLKPYMDVKLLGPTATHGKPVGFFPIPVGDWYIFPVSFRSTNVSGASNYFNGLSVTTKVADGLNKNWGDLSETSLASAIKYITTGSFRLQADVIYQEQLPEIKISNSILDGPSFKGTIDTRKLK